MFRHQSQKHEALKRVPLFRDLNDRQLSEVAKHVDEVDSGPGQVLVREGELGHEMVIVVKGKARVEHDGKVLGHVESGDFFGEMALIDGHVRNATVTTEEPSELMLIHSRSFDTLLDTVPGLSRTVLRTVMRRLREREQVMVD